MIHLTANSDRLIIEFLLYFYYQQIKKLFMEKPAIYLIVCMLAIYHNSIYSKDFAKDNQSKISIPAAGNSWLINDLMHTEDVITSSGITNWKETSDRIRTWFRTENTGELNLSVRCRISSGSSKIEILAGGQKKVITLTNKEFDTINLGTFSIDKPGYQWVEFSGISKEGTTFADVSHILISGKAAHGKIYFVKDDFYFGRRGPSVHLRYDIPAEASDIEWFYNEITIPEGNDVLGSYYMANGFADGYFGIQCNSPTERRILFSVWSPYKTDNPGEIPDDYKIILLKKGKDVITKEFGNEGSGGQSYRKFYWKTGNSYRFLLSGKPSVNNSTDYTAYFFAPETGKWELIASFRRPKTNNYLKSLYSFLENFMPETGPVTRKGNYSNQWVRDSSGKWHELTAVKFTADATARKESRLDYSGGVENGYFFLKNCGFFSDKTEVGLLFTRPGTGNPPAIDFSELQ